LATGNYGKFNGIAKSSPGVTITAAAGATPTMTLYFAMTSPVAQWLILDHLTIQGASFITGAVNHITIQNSTIADGILFDVSANNNICSNCPQMNNNAILFNNDLINMSAVAVPNNPSTGYEGRLHFLAMGSRTNNPPAGITITNSTFTGGCADGIQMGGPAGAGNGLTIGPGNVFYNIQQSYNGTTCNGHMDSIQLNGTSTPGPVITGNYFHDDADGIVDFDYANDANINNNVIERLGIGYGIGGTATGTTQHNTLYDSQIACGVTHEGNVCGATFINNIMTSFVDSGGGTGAPALVDNNLCTSGVCSSPFTNYGSHNITGTPTYVGGTSPTTYSAFALTSSSIGHNAANNGNDIGINVANVATAVPSPPTNLIIVSVQ
jgi:hypothetical protein